MPDAALRHQVARVMAETAPRIEKPEPTQPDIEGRQGIDLGDRMERQNRAKNAGKTFIAPVGPLDANPEPLGRTIAARLREGGASATDEEVIEAVREVQADPREYFRERGVRGQATVAASKAKQAKAGEAAMAKLGQKVVREQREERRKATPIVVPGKPRASAYAGSEAPRRAHKGRGKAKPEPPAEVAAAQAAPAKKALFAIDTSHGKAMWAEFKHLFSTKSVKPLRHATFLGKLVVATPMALPAILAGLVLVGGLAVAAGFLTQSNDYGAFEYGTTTVIAVASSIANMFIVATNAVLAGIFANLKIIVLSLLTIANSFVRVVFEGLYAAVNKLLDFANLGGPLALPAVNTAGVESKSTISVGYLVPRNVVDCGHAVSFATFIDGEPQCSNFVNFRPFLGKKWTDIVTIPGAPAFNEVPDIAWEGLKDLWGATKGGTESFLDWVASQARSVVP